MKKHIGKIFFSAIFLVAFIAYNFISYNNYFNKELSITNNILSTSYSETTKYSSFYTPKLDFKDMPISPIRDVTLNILDKHNLNDIPMLLKAGRYYIPLDYIVDVLDYSILNTDNEMYSIQNDDHKILLTNTAFTRDTISGSLRGNLIYSNDSAYISISDIEQLFNLIAVFIFDEKTISFVKANNKPANFEKKDETEEESNNFALLRLEDFTCGDAYANDETQTKVKIMANYLNSHDIKYHVGWIPRFKAPTDNIDNNLLENPDIKCISFVNLLDYLLNKNAEIGLHGYTHQHGDERSAVGEDLATGINDTEAETRSVIENGIDTAAALNIPITFYESPHYYASDSQLKIIGEYFKYQYEPYKYSKHIEKTESDNIFVPTPLGYVLYSNDSGVDTSSIIDGLKDTSSDSVKSFFYHPSIESNFIDFNLNDNKLNYKFHKDSPLKAIVNALEENNYKTIHINEINQ